MEEVDDSVLVVEEVAENVDCLLVEYMPDDNVVKADCNSFVVFVDNCNLNLHTVVLQRNSLDQVYYS